MQLAKAINPVSPNEPESCLSENQYIMLLYIAPGQTRRQEEEEEEEEEHKLMLLCYSNH
jgi:hypothetical protein